MHLKYALRGDLARWAKQELAAAEKAVTGGVRDTGQWLKADRRQRTATAGLGPKVARAWDARFYPKGQNSLGAAAVVYSKARRIHGAFAEGVTIRTKRARWLVIPLAEARRRRLDQDFRHDAVSESGMSSRRGIWSNVAQAERVYGKLRFVKLKGGRALLVADNLTAGLRRSKMRRTRDGAEYSPIGGRRASVPVFLLVRQVRLTRRIDLGQGDERALADLPGRILDNWPDRTD